MWSTNREDYVNDNRTRFLPTRTPSVIRAMLTKVAGKAYHTSLWRLISTRCLEKRFLNFATLDILWLPLISPSVISGGVCVFDFVFAFGLFSVPCLPAINIKTSRRSFWKPRKCVLVRTPRKRRGLEVQSHVVENRSLYQSETIQYTQKLNILFLSTFEAREKQLDFYVRPLGNFCWWRCVHIYQK